MAQEQRGVTLLNSGQFYNAKGAKLHQSINGVPVGTTNSTEHDAWFFSKSAKPAPGRGCYVLEGKACALIINNLFDNKIKRQNVEGYDELFRDGAEGDSEKMRELFKKHLNFDFVDMKTNVISKRLSKILEDFRDEAKERECGSCFVVIMSHGGTTADSVTMDDMNQVDLYQDIVYPFSDHDDFRYKPKIFIVQACQSFRDQPERREEEGGGPIRDILIAHSTIPHKTANRTKSVGAFYIAAIIKIFQKFAREDPIHIMLDAVFKELQDTYGQTSQAINMGFGEYRFIFEDQQE